MQTSHSSSITPVRPSRGAYSGRGRRLLACLAALLVITGTFAGRPEAAGAAVHWTAPRGADPAAPAGAVRGRALATFNARPLSFEPNRGQAAPGLPFLAHGQGYSIGLSADGTTVTLGDATMRMTLLGADPAAHGQGQQQLPGTVGYLGAGDPRPALASLPTYAAVRFEAVYPGIDVVYYGSRGRLEYDFLVAPSADPRRIRLSFPGAGVPSIAANGDLILRGATGVVREQGPVAYQVVGGARRAVAADYVVTGRSVGIRVGTYDPHVALVIDPVLIYSTYYGGPGDDRGAGIAVDGQGNIYIVGTTTSGSSTSLAFVSKLDPTGQHVLYLKYIANRYSGGHTADEADCNSTGAAIAVDARGTAYVTGLYGDVDPSLDGALCSVKVVLWARIRPSGKATVAVFGKASSSQGNAIAVDGQGNSYITGATDQSALSFPVTQGAFQTRPGIDREADGVAGDAFVLKVGPRGNIVYGTFLGGSGIDEGNGIAVDGAGNAYVVGTSGIDIITGYIDFPRTRNAIQLRPGNPYAAAFLSVLSADGSRLLYSTYLSGKNGEAAQGVALDGQGDVYVVGSSDSDNFPTTPNAYKRACGTDGLCNPGESCTFDPSRAENVCHVAVAEDVFVAKIDPRQSGTAGLLYCTYLGGENRDLGLAIAVDQSGAAYVTGRTASLRFPLVDPLQATNAGDWDAFVAKIIPARAGTASLVFATYLGGNGYEEGDGLALDGHGNVYITGYTSSARTFPTKHPLQAGNAGGDDAFITRIDGIAG